MEHTFVTVNFNTPELIVCLCSSLKKHHPNSRIIVFDNSNMRPLPKEQQRLFGMDYYDNTNGQILNFDKIILDSGLKTNDKCVKQNNLGSCKHCITIQWLLDHVNSDNMILLDSDVLIRKPIDWSFGNNITVGSINTEEVRVKSIRKPRIYPFIQYFNLSEIRQLSIKFYTPTRIVGLDQNTERVYDTGASFYEDLISKKLPVNTSIPIYDYIVHLNSGSWSGEEYWKWLFKHKDLWYC